MSGNIRRLEEKDFRDYAELVANAYPGWKITTSEEKHRLEDRLLKTHKDEPGIAFFGYFRDGRLIGGMRLHHFDMNYAGTWIKAGGLGLVAVGLPHKKEKVARELVSYFLRYFREKGVSVAMLYPFRPDFYKRMGFGYGTKMNQYRIKPTDFPKGNTKKHVGMFETPDRQLLLDCHNRFAASRHGMIKRTRNELENVLVVPENKLAVYKAAGKIQGYVLFTFRKAAENNLLINDIFIKEFIYENRQAQEELLTFLHSQEDQVSRIILNTFDEDIHFLFGNPLSGNDNLFTSVYHETNIQGVGLMYRIVDLHHLFSGLHAHHFNGLNCRLKITLKDGFLPDHNSMAVIHFIDGKAHTVNDGSYEAELKTGICEFSSLIMGAVNLRTLHRYGLASLTEENLLRCVDGLFSLQGKPYCTTIF